MNFQALLESFPIMLWGMFGIFFVIGIIFVIVWALNKAFPGTK